MAKNITHDRWWVPKGTFTRVTKYRCARIKPLTNCPTTARFTITHNAIDTRYEHCERRGAPTSTLAPTRDPREKVDRTEEPKLGLWSTSDILVT